MDDRDEFCWLKIYYYNSLGNECQLNSSANSLSLGKDCHSSQNHPKKPIFVIWEEEERILDFNFPSIFYICFYHFDKVDDDEVRCWIAAVLSSCRWCTCTAVVCLSRSSWYLGSQLMSFFHALFCINHANTLIMTSSPLKVAC